VRGTNAGLPGTGPYSAGGNPCAVSLRGTLTLSIGPNDYSRTELPGAVAVPVLQILLSSDFVEDITVTSLAVTEAGTINPATEISEVRLYLDADRDGIVGVGDLPICYSASLSGGTFTFTGFSETVPAGESTALLVTYDLAPAATMGATLQVSLLQDSDVQVSGSLTAVPIVTGAPVAGAMKFLATTGSLTVSAGPGNPPEAAIAPGSPGVAVMQFQLSASSPEGVTVTEIRLTGTGAVDESSDITAVRLYLDSDGSNGFDPGPDTLISGPFVFQSDEGSISFPVSIGVPAGGCMRVFVVCDFAASCAEGADFQALISSGSDVTGTGDATGQGAPVSGAPAQGPVLTLHEGRFMRRRNDSGRSRRPTLLASSRVFLRAFHQDCEEPDLGIEGLRGRGVKL
jgi:hypothetical protein